jgi:hypothetical protein
VQRVEIRGCLPALLVLAILAAVATAFVVAGFALAIPVVAFFFVVGVLRALWRALTGRSVGHGPGGAGRGPPPPGTIEVVDREPVGPVVDVGPAPRRDGLERPPGGPGAPGA